MNKVLILLMDELYFPLPFFGSHQKIVLVGKLLEMGDQVKMNLTNGFTL